MVAVAALEEMASHSLGTAVGYILHCPPVTGRHGLTVPVAVLGPAGPENIRYPWHVAALQVGHETIQGFGEGMETLVC